MIFLLGSLSGLSSRFHRSIRLLLDILLKVASVASANSRLNTALMPWLPIACLVLWLTQRHTWSCLARLYWQILLKQHVLLWRLLVQLLAILWGLLRCDDHGRCDIGWRMSLHVILLCRLHSRRTGCLTFLLHVLQILIWDDSAGSIASLLGCACLLMKQCNLFILQPLLEGLVVTGRAVETLIV